MRIAEDPKVDLILGLQTIKKVNLVKVIPEFFQNSENIVTEKNMTHMSKIQRLDQSKTMVINQMDVPLLLEAESDTVTSITDPTLPPVITSLEGTKPLDADSRW